VLCCFRVDIDGGKKKGEKRGGCGEKVKNSGEKVKNCGEKNLFILKTHDEGREYSSECAWAGSAICADLERNCLHEH
jgi:hypothetical protein